MQPADMYVLIARNEPQPQVSPGGIYLAATSTTTLGKGRVIATGKDIPDLYGGPRKGVTAVYRSSKAYEVESMDEKFVLVHADDVIGWE